MRKWFTLLVLVFVFAVLVACSDDSSNADSENTDDPSDAETEDTTEGETNENNGEEVTISIASWGFGTGEDLNTRRLLVDAFMEEYPHITVEIDESIAAGEDWMESLASAASAGTLPDVFQLSAVPTGVANDWMMPLNEYTESDEDFQSIPQSAKESATYGGNVYALPMGQNFLGYYVNKDVFNQANLDVPYLGMSLDEFENAIRNVTNINQGVIGLNQTNAIPEWYPISASDEMGWYTFNEGFSLNSNEFIGGINLARDFNTNGYAYEALTEDQQANFNGEDSNEVWYNNGIGIRWDGTWSIGGFEQQADFEWDFIGIPGERNVITHDFFGISSVTEHSEEAYMLAKWLGYGKDGYMKMIEITDAEEELSISGVPLNTDQEVLDAYFERVDVPGLQEAYENIDNAVVEPFKTTPGYAQARWDAPTGVEAGEEANATIGTVINESVSGNLNYENYASQMNELANQKYEEAKAAMSE